MRILRGRSLRHVATVGEVVVEQPTLNLVRIEAAWDRFRKFAFVFRQSRLGMIGFVILLIFIVVALSASFLTSGGLLRDPNAPLCGTDYHICRSTDPELQDLNPPDSRVWLGTDHQGRDIFSRLWWGTQFTVLIGFMASVLSMGLGTFVGMISGYYGGWLDEVLMRITDFFLVLPTLVLALILSGFFQQSGGGNTWTMVFVIGISLWSSTARLVRSQVLSLKQRQFIERARAVGAGSSRIVWRHIFPNAFSLVFAEAILTIAVAILTEAFLDYIRLGPQDANTWGKMIEDAISHNVIILRLYWWIVAPGLMIVFVVLGFTLLGYALDEIFNPRLRKR